MKTTQRNKTTMSRRWVHLTFNEWSTTLRYKYSITVLVLWYLNVCLFIQTIEYYECVSPITIYIFNRILDSAFYFYDGASSPEDYGRLSCSAHGTAHEPSKQRDWSSRGRPLGSRGRHMNEAEFYAQENQCRPIAWDRSSRDRRARSCYPGRDTWPWKVSNLRFGM